jgi:hypothetical protein
VGEGQASEVGSIQDLGVAPILGHQDVGVALGAENQAMRLELGDVSQPPMQVKERESPGLVEEGDPWKAADLAGALGGVGEDQDVGVLPCRR